MLRDVGGALGPFVLLFTIMFVLFAQALAVLGVGKDQTAIVNRRTKTAGSDGRLLEEAEAFEPPPDYLGQWMRFIVNGFR